MIKAQCGILKLIARVETSQGKVGDRGVTGQAVVDGGAAVNMAERRQVHSVNKTRGGGKKAGVELKPSKIIK